MERSITFPSIDISFGIALLFKLLTQSIQIIMPKKSPSRPNHPMEEKPATSSQVDNKEEQAEFSLYSFLEVDEKATSEQIKKQYRKLVLQYHPDKNQDDPTAREKFQKLKQAYDILMDDDKRKEYDETGHVGEDFNETTFQSAYDYFRKMFKKVTKEDIDDFSKQYRQGPMEKEDLLQYYNQHEGDMTQLLQCIPLSTSEDIPRFTAFYEEQIELGVISKHKIFDKTKNKVRRLKNEEKQFEEEQKKEMQALVMAIQNKKGQNIDFLASLEQKYGMGKKRKIEKETQKTKKQSKHKK